MKTGKWLVAILILLSGVLTAEALDDYTYDGASDTAGPVNHWDSLDGTWDHDNGSDLWDGSRIGYGNPGGIMTLTEGDVTFLRLQDAGEPGIHGYGDPNSFCKLSLAHQLNGAMNTFMDEGITLSFRMRLATTPPLDDRHPDTIGSSISSWPAKGVGYPIFENGQGMVGLGQADGGKIISFSLCHKSRVKGRPGFENVTGDVLVMNNLAGTTPSPFVDTVDNHPSIKARNNVPIADATEWNTFDIRITAGGAGTHQVAVSVNGKPAGVWDVTAGTKIHYRNQNCLLMGLGYSPEMGAFDLDFVKVSASSL